MLLPFILCAAITANAETAAEAKAEPAAVHVRFVYVKEQGEDANVPKDLRAVEPWIVKLTAKKGEKVVAVSDWAALSNKEDSFSGRGMNFEAKAVRIGDDYAVEAAGCVGFGFDIGVTVKVGERGAYPVPDVRGMFLVVSTTDK